LNSRLNDYITSSIKTKFEGKCSRHGYIKTGSTTIVSKTSGTIVSGFLNGYTSFDVTFRAEVCNPQVGYIFKATIVNSNKFGILAEAFVDKRPVIEVIIAKKNNIVAFENLEIGQEIQVKVLGKKFQLNDTRVVVVAKLVVDTSDGNIDNANSNLDDVLSDGEYVDDCVDVGVISDDDDASEKSEKESDEEEDDEEDEEETEAEAAAAADPDDDEDVDDDADIDADAEGDGGDGVADDGDSVLPDGDE
jgi:DNA-directed RNA polymerase subunit E'/Rpb7